MSWATVRTAMVSAIEALTPGNVSIGGAVYQHVADEQLEEVSYDRAFSIDIATPPTHISQTTITGRWMTEAEVNVKYVKTRYREADQDRIAADCIQIQQTLLSYENLGSDACGIISQGEGYTSTSLSEDSQGNYILTIGLVIHHQ